MKWLYLLIALACLAMCASSVAAHQAPAAAAWGFAAGSWATNVAMSFAEEWS